jgi:hypothetical protein
MGGLQADRTISEAVMIQAILIFPFMDPSLPNGKG